MAREREVGVEFLVRMGGRERVHIRCTVAALRSHAPDLVPSDTAKLKAKILNYLAEERESLREFVSDEVARQVRR